MTSSTPKVPGEVGDKILARTNAFVMTWARHSSNTGYVFHYDEIKPQWQTAREFTLGNRKGTELVMRLQNKTRPDLFNPLGAFDGKKNLFSFSEYGFKAETFNVPWEDGPSNRPKEVAIRVVFVKRIDVGTLHHLTDGDPNSIRPESDSTTAISMLNLFVQSAPRMTDPRIFNSKSFFTPLGKRTSERIRPLELWRGHFQSVRPTLGKILVNVDTTIGVILPGRPLEQICAEFLQLRNLRDLGKQDHVPRLRTFLKGVKIEVDLPGHSGKRAKSIKDVIPDAASFKFEKGGDRMTVADHFARAHNHKIRSGTLGVKIGSGAVFPITVCRTIQQLYQNRSSGDVVREALEFTPRDPQGRMNAIMAGWQQLGYTQSSFLLGAGISVNPEPLKVRGRLLPSPMITFGDKELTPQRPGAWDVMQKRFTQPATLKAWTVVDFANADSSTLNIFLTDLMQCMKERGLNIPPPSDTVRRPANSNIADALRYAERSASVSLILVILPESAPHPYREAKRYGDITRGVATQCVKWSRKLASDVQARRANQYQNNLLLKINTKLGGINYAPVDAAMSYLKSVPTMVIGADVSHPAPGSMLPSISSLVSSTDPRLCQYVASIRVQPRRVEMIEAMAEMFENALRAFLSKNGFLPQKIFMFRDGVSEGEFAIVEEQEIAAMKMVLANAYGKNNSKWPQINFIIVGKRHHFRFFAERDGQDPKGNGNLYAGFVVDRDIVHPVYQDFYLQSQPGLKGTSRPSHYTVLRNDSKLTADQLQQIAYALCHCYSRATRSVKIPAPVYYADLVCRRAKFHLDIDNLDTMSIASDEQHHVDYFRQHFTDINHEMKPKMYFV